MTDNNPSWDTVHGSLIRSLRAAELTLVEADAHIDEITKQVERLDSVRERAIADKAALTAAIDNGGFTAPEGWDLYGNPIPEPEPIDDEDDEQITEPTA